MRASLPGHPSSVVGLEETFHVCCFYVAVWCWAWWRAVCLPPVSLKRAEWWQGVLIVVAAAFAAIVALLQQDHRRVQRSGLNSTGVRSDLALAVPALLPVGGCSGHRVTTYQKRSRSGARSPRSYLPRCDDRQRGSFVPSLPTALPSQEPHNPICRFQIPTEDAGSYTQRDRDVASSDSSSSSRACLRPARRPLQQLMTTV